MENKNQIPTRVILKTENISGVGYQHATFTISGVYDKIVEYNLSEKYITPSGCQSGQAKLSITEIEIKYVKNKPSSELNKIFQSMTIFTDAKIVLLEK